VKIDKGQQKLKIICSNQQSNLRGSCQSIFSLSWHHPSVKVVKVVVVFAGQKEIKEQVI